MTAPMIGKPRRRCAAEIITMISDCQLRLAVGVARLQQLHDRPGGFHGEHMPTLSGQVVNMAKIASRLEAELESLADLMRKDPAQLVAELAAGSTDG